MRNDRDRGVIVKVLDLTKLEDEALEWRKQTRPECIKANIHGGEWAVAEKNGTLYALCTEGVGYSVTDDDQLELDLHGNYSVIDNVLSGPVPHKTQFDMVPFGSYSLTPDEIKELPIKEEVDLADFIRSFGARLENNFWNWFKELS